jgi:hypothetical protein
MKKTILILSSVLIFLSCKKEGCTDVFADNYDEKAKKNNGSCQFSGNLTVWYGEDVATEIFNAGYSNVYFYLNGQLQGSTSSSVFVINPSCNQGFISKDINFGSKDSDTFQLQVKGDDVDVLWDVSVQVSAKDNCRLLELVL